MDRNEFVSKKSKEILETSGVLDGQYRIKDELLSGPGQNSEVLCRFEKGRVTLVWGRGYVVKEGCVDHDKDYHYYLVQVFVDPDTEQLSIKGEAASFLQRREWLNRKKVNEALADAYMKPDSCHSYGPPPSSESSSHWTGSIS